MEYLLDVQETLSANLNGLAKKYAAKKREVESLSKNLARQDAEVATLRDELHYSRLNESPTEVAKLNPSFFPSQERRDDVETVPAEDVAIEEPASHPSTAGESTNIPSAESTNLIQLNVVSSVHGKFVFLGVSSSITVQDLKKVLLEQLPAIEALGAEVLSISFKGKRLDDPGQTIDDIGVDADNNTLVLEATPEVATPSESRPATEVQEKEAIGSKLDDLVSAFMLAQEELVSVSESLRHQVSSHDKHNEAILAFIGSQLQNLQSLVRHDIERNIREVVTEHLDKQVHEKEIESDCPKTPSKPGAQLDIGEIESDKSIDGCSVEASQVQAGSHDTDDHNNLWIDTKADFQGPLCDKAPSSLTDATSEEFDVPNEVNVDATRVDVNAVDDDSDKCVFPLPNAYNLEEGIDKSAKEERPPTPNRAEIKNDTTKPIGNSLSPSLSPKLISMPTPPTLKKIHANDGAGHFRFSEYSEECVDVDIVNESYDSNNDMSRICGFNPEIKSDLCASEDMESVCIEVSQTEFQAVAAANPETHEGADKCFGRKRSSGKKMMSFKKMVPKWKKKSDKKSNDSKLYEM
jgi:hypothetical protein